MWNIIIGINRASNSNSYSYNPTTKKQVLTRSQPGWLRTSLTCPAALPARKNKTKKNKKKINFFENKQKLYFQAAFARE